MRPILILTLWLLLLSIASGKAQDSLQFNSGEWVVGRIIEIRKKEIQFRKKELPDGPDFIFLKSELQNFEKSKKEVQPIVKKKKGTKTDLHLLASQRKQEESLLNETLITPLNRLSLDIFETLSGRISLTYERFFKNQRTSLLGTCSVSFINKESILNYNYTTKKFEIEVERENLLSPRADFNAFGKSIYLGMGIRNHFPKNRKSSLFLGLRLDGGYFRYKIKVPETPPLTPPNNNQQAYITGFSSINNFPSYILRTNFEFGFRANLFTFLMAYIQVDIGYTHFILDQADNYQIKDRINWMPKGGIGYMFGGKRR